MSDMITNGLDWDISISDLLKGIRDPLPYATNYLTGFEQKSDPP